MALTTELVLLGLYDAKITPMTADTTGTPTYGTAIDVPGVLSLSWTATMENKELKGDGSILATFSRITGGEVEIQMAKLPLSALATLQGGTLTASGSTPNMTQEYALTDTVFPAYFKVEGVWDAGEVGVGSQILTVYKCKCMEPPTIAIADANGDYGDVTVKAKAVRCISDTKLLMGLKAYETKTGIA